MEIYIFIFNAIVMICSNYYFFRSGYSKGKNEEIIDTNERLREIINKIDRFKN